MDEVCSFLTQEGCKNLWPHELFILIALGKQLNHTDRCAESDLKTAENLLKADSCPKTGRREKGEEGLGILHRTSCQMSLGVCHIFWARCESRPISPSHRPVVDLEKKTNAMYSFFYRESASEKRKSPVPSCLPWMPASVDISNRFQTIIHL